MDGGSKTAGSACCARQRGSAWPRCQREVTARSGSGRAGSGRMASTLSTSRWAQRWPSSPELFRLFITISFFRSRFFAAVICPSIRKKLKSVLAYFFTVAPRLGNFFLPFFRRRRQQIAARHWCRRWWRLARARARATTPPHDARAPTGASAFNTRRALAARAP